MLLEHQAPFATAGPSAAPGAHATLRGGGCEETGSAAAFHPRRAGQPLLRTLACWRTPGYTPGGSGEGKQGGVKPTSKRWEAKPGRRSGYQKCSQFKESSLALLQGEGLGARECWSVAQESQRCGLPSLLLHSPHRLQEPRRVGLDLCGAPLPSQLQWRGRLLWLPTFCGPATFFCPRSCFYVKSSIGVSTVSGRLLL